MTPLKLLLIDDNDADIDLFLNSFDNSGLKNDLRVARTIDAARTLLQSLQPDLVLLDMRMPRNGYTVLEYIRNTPETAHIKVVVLTGADDSRDQAFAREHDVVTYMIKPFTMKEFVQAVQDAGFGWVAVR